jgi:hypothetical protein
MQDLLQKLIQLFHLPRHRKMMPALHQRITSSIASTRKFSQNFVGEGNFRKHFVFLTVLLLPGLVARVKLKQAQMGAQLVEFLKTRQSNAAWASLAGFAVLVLVAPEDSCVRVLRSFVATLATHYIAAIFEESNLLSICCQVPIMKEVVAVCSAVTWSMRGSNKEIVWQGSDVFVALDRRRKRIEKIWYKKKYPIVAPSTE